MGSGSILPYSKARLTRGAGDLSIEPPPDIPCYGYGRIARQKVDAPDKLRARAGYPGYHRCRREHLTQVNFWDHFRVTGSALKNWLVAQLQDSLAVGLLWLVGLLIIGVPWAPFWAVLGARVSVRAPDRRRAGRGRSGPDRHVQVGRLGTSALCSDSVRSHRRRGWFSAPALPDEAHRQSAGVGFHSCANRAGNDYSVLGRAAGSAVAGVLYAYKARQARWCPDFTRLFVLRPLRLSEDYSVRSGTATAGATPALRIQRSIVMGPCYNFLFGGIHLRQSVDLLDGPVPRH